MNMKLLGVLLLSLPRWDDRPPNILKVALTVHWGYPRKLAMQAAARVWNLDHLIWIPVMLPLGHYAPACIQCRVHQRSSVWISTFCSILVCDWSFRYVTACDKERS